MRLASAAPLAPTSPLPLDRETVERFGSERGEPGWLCEARLAALSRFTPEAWPTGAEEEWRRFPLVGLPTGPLAGARSVAAYDHPGTDLPAGVVFGDLRDVADAAAELVRKWLGSGDGLATHAAFRALADALWSAGSFVYVPAGLSVACPLWIVRHWEPGEAACLSRTVVVAEEGSSVTVVEEVFSEAGAPRLAIGHLEVIAGPGARVRYVGIQRFGEGVWDLGFQRYISHRDSDLASFNIFVGSSRSKVGVESDIRGDGATVKLYGLVAAGDEQRIDLNSFQRVDGKGSNSDLLYLSALYEAAKAVYYGKIRVEPTSSGTGSYQECRNMLLSDRAGADPIPVLEILTNDVVRCGHGATAGAIEEDELFYVQSRGLGRDDAERLLVRGFFQRVVGKCEDESVRQRALAALAPRLGLSAATEFA